MAAKKKQKDNPVKGEVPRNRSKPEPAKGKAKDE